MTTNLTAAAARQTLNREITPAYQPLPYMATAEAQTLLSIARRHAESAVSRIVTAAALDPRSWPVCEHLLTLKLLEALVDAGCCVYRKPVPIRMPLAIDAVLSPEGDLESLLSALVTLSAGRLASVELALDVTQFDAQPELLMSRDCYVRDSADGRLQIVHCRPAGISRVEGKWVLLIDLELAE